MRLSRMAERRATRKAVYTALLCLMSHGAVACRAPRAGPKPEPAAASLALSEPASPWAPCLHQAPMRTGGAGVLAELVVAQAFWLDGGGFDNLQPSGLAVRGDQLLTVSDKHDDVVFSLVCRGEVAQVRPLVRFAAPPSGAIAALAGLDWEGIAIAESGKLLLASEAASRVLELDPGTGASEWVSPPLEPAVAGARLLTRHNAKLEGITSLPGGGILLAAERDPRGLIELFGGAVRGTPLAQTRLRLPKGRGPDFSGLDRDGSRLFALLRAAHTVVELERSAADWQERPAWTYGATENDPRWAYADREFGLAEGLALTPTHIWIVFDNNGQPRQSAPADTRPLLVAFHRPKTGDRTSAPAGQPAHAPRAPRRAVSAD